MRRLRNFFKSQGLSIERKVYVATRIRSSRFHSLYGGGGSLEFFQVSGSLYIGRKLYTTTRTSLFPFPEPHISSYFPHISPYFLNISSYVPHISYVSHISSYLLRIPAYFFIFPTFFLIFSIHFFIFLH